MNCPDIYHVCSIGYEGVCGSGFHEASTPVKRGRDPSLFGHDNKHIRKSLQNHNRLRLIYSSLTSPSILDERIKINAINTIVRMPHYLSN
jgi:hypothetical protein